LQRIQRGLTAVAAVSAVNLPDMFRWLLLRFLPRRLLPLLMVWEIVQLVRRLRAGRPLFGDDRSDDRIIEGTATPVRSRPIESHR
jgi:hypothetical protein